MKHHSRLWLAVIILSFLLLAGIATGEELKVPAERDEDISGTEISVQIE